MVQFGQSLHIPHHISKSFLLSTVRIHNDKKGALFVKNVFDLLFLIDKYFETRLSLELIIIFAKTLGRTRRSIEVNIEKNTFIMTKGRLCQNYQDSDIV